MYYITVVNPKIVSDAYNSSLCIRVTDELRDWLDEQYPARGELSAYIRGLLETELSNHQFDRAVVLTETLQRVRGESGSEYS